MSRQFRTNQSTLLTDAVLTRTAAWPVRTLPTASPLDRRSGGTGYASWGSAQGLQPGAADLISHLVPAFRIRIEFDHRVAHDRRSQWGISRLANSSKLIPALSA